MERLIRPALLSILEAIDDTVKLYRRAWYAALLAAATVGTSVPSFAEPSLPCAEVVALVAMTQARSDSELTAARKAAGPSYFADIVFAARDFSLHMKDMRAARHFLQLAPTRQNDIAFGSSSEPVDREIMLSWLSEQLCKQETDQDMIALSRFEASLPGLFARAVILVPDMMPTYLAYDLRAVGDPHNDSNLQMEKVCRVRHAQFLRAVDGLDDADRDWFNQTVFDKRKCKALLLPEADD